MQGTIDIMAMMQKSSSVVQKTNTASLGKEVEKYSFKNELEAARKNTAYNNKDNKQASLAKQTEIVKDNKNEKLAKVMSSNNIKAEKDLAVSKDTAQVKEAESVKADIKAEEPIIDEAVETTDTELAGLIASAEELIQQLIQLLSSGSNKEATETNMKQTVENMQTAVEKLEQIIAKPLETEAENYGIALKDLKVELKELMQQLKAKTYEANQEVADKPTLQQTVITIKHLINKMNELQPKLQQKLNEPEMLQETTDEAQKITAEGSKEIKKADSKTVEMEATNENVSKNQAFESNTNENINKENKKEEKEFHNSKEFRKLSKPVITVDKPYTEDLKEVNLPHSNKAEFQINVKEMNLNFKKAEMVPINKADIVNQVIKKADIILREGHSEMIMKLEPESLGKLNLKIVVENGLTTAKFIAESQQVKEIIESSFNQLKDALQEKGIAVQNFSVAVGQQFGDSSSKQSFNQWKQSIKYKNKTAIGEFMELNDEAMLTKNPYNFHEGKVDYRA